MEHEKHRAALARQPHRGSDRPGGRGEEEIIAPRGARPASASPPRGNVPRLAEVAADFVFGYIRDIDALFGAEPMSHSRLSCLSLFFPWLLNVLMVSATIAADFPPPSQLQANPSLPDPLVMFDGARVTTKEQWESNASPS